jgi:hypothetical protein
MVRNVTHPIPVALGLTTLLMVPNVTPLISPSHSLSYHFQGSPTVVFLPILLFFLLLWFVLSALLLVVRRHARIDRLVWTTLMSMLPWIVLKVWAELLDWRVPHRLSLLLFLASITTFLVLSFFWRPSFQKPFHHAQSFTATLLGFASISGMLVLVQLGWFGWQARNQNAPIALHHSVTTANAKPRIVWLLLDELSYRQLYEHRYPGLALPAFDRLANQSTVFTHTIPAGFMTEYAVPSLLSATPADGARASADGKRFFLHNPEVDQWQPFDPHQTVFQDALDRGYITAVIGWFNPYCRILPQVLDRCLWSNHYPGPGGLSTDGSFLHNFLVPIHDLAQSAARYLHWDRRNLRVETTTTALHIRDYRELFAAADTLLADPSANFLYIHLPVPHPNGIYSRATQQLTTSPSTYIDNLALADAYLAHLRQQLEQTNQWDSTTLIVMGDHGWRTAPMWAFDPAWSSEEQAASDGGRFDDRPAYILKLPNQHTPARIDIPYPARNTRALLDALMDQRIHTPQDLANWIASQPRDQQLN